MESRCNAPKTLSMLIVEDDRVAIEVMGFIVSKRYPECGVSFAYDGEMGLEIFQERLPDIVITDINMPKMDGIKMAEAIKSIRAGTKIIVLTAYNHKIHQEHFAELGISEHLLKPVQFEKLFAAVDKAIEEIQSG